MTSPRAYGAYVVAFVTQLYSEALHGGSHCLAVLGSHGGLAYVFLYACCERVEIVVVLGGQGRKVRVWPHTRRYRLKILRTSSYIASSHVQFRHRPWRRDVVARESAGRRVFLHMFFDEGYHSLHVGIVAIGVSSQAPPLLRNSRISCRVLWQTSSYCTFSLAAECFEHQVDSFIVVVFFHNCRCFCQNSPMGRFISTERFSGSISVMRSLLAGT